MRSSDQCHPKILSKCVNLVTMISSLMSSHLSRMPRILSIHCSLFSISIDHFYSIFFPLFSFLEMTLWRDLILWFWSSSFFLWRSLNNDNVWKLERIGRGNVELLYLCWVWKSFHEWNIPIFIKKKSLRRAAGTFKYSQTLIVW